MSNNILKASIVLLCLVLALVLAQCSSSYQGVVEGKYIYEGEYFLQIYGYGCSYDLKVKYSEFQAYYIGDLHPMDMMRFECY